jgi:replicative DNA helicase
MKQQHKIKLLVIDYLQLIRSTRDRGSRNDEVTEISSGCKGLAKELNIPIILVSQLSRAADKDARPPKLSDLRDSGSIEQDADVVLFLWRDPDYKMNDDDLVVPVKLSVDKNRDGLSGVKIPMVFHRELTKFVEGSICSDI